MTVAKSQFLSKEHVLSYHEANPQFDMGWRLGSAIESTMYDANGILDGPLRGKIGGHEIIDYAYVGKRTNEITLEDLDECEKELLILQGHVKDAYHIIAALRDTVQSRERRA